MLNATVIKNVNAPADNVWKTLSDFENIQNLHPWLKAPAFSILKTKRRWHCHVLWHAA